MSRFCSILLTLFLSATLLYAQSEKSDAQQVLESMNVPNTQSLGLNGKVKCYTLVTETEYKDSLTSSEHFFVCKISFDTIGNMIKVCSTEDTTKGAYCSFKYDENGNLVECCRYAVDHAVKQRMICRYTADGKLTYSEYQDYDWYGSRQMTSRRTSLYDKVGTKIRCEIFTYDNEGKVRNRKVYQYGKTEFAEVSEYDSNNKLILKTKEKRVSLIDDFDDPHFFVLGKNRGFDQVVFDEVGNMTKRTRFYLDRIERFSCQIEYW